MIIGYHKRNPLNPLRVAMAMVLVILSHQCVSPLMRAGRSVVDEDTYPLSTVILMTAHSPASLVDSSPHARPPTSYFMMSAP
eukprot:scaffold11642_cov140-Skeletonema_menzelii.AAC.1